MKNLFDAIENLLLKKSNPVIAIDGPCASGKTTLAFLLHEKYGFQVIHTDSFFLPPEMRDNKRLTQPGGNIHYERLNDEVVNGIASGSKFVYGIYSCQTGILSESLPVSPEKPIIIEGSYALHPKIELSYDFKIFVEAEYNIRLSRILQRNGAESLEVFKTKWIPLENLYFKEFDIKSKCDITVKTDR